MNDRGESDRLSLYAPRYAAEKGWLARSYLANPIKHKKKGERVSILLEANGLVHGERQESYGHPRDDFARTATLASTILAKKLKEPLTPEDVALFMVCVKLSRQVNAPKRDNLVDAAGYLETLSMVIEDRP